MHWHESYDNVTALGMWLLIKHSLTAEQLQQYYEQPWSYDTEWNEYQEATPWTTNARSA